MSSGLMSQGNPTSGQLNEGLPLNVKQSGGNLGGVSVFPHKRVSLYPIRGFPNGLTVGVVAVVTIHPRVYIWAIRVVLKPQTMKCQHIGDEK